MDLIGRYLQAVKFWLPKGQQNDILAELSEDIRSQVEEAEAKLGHTLNDAELGELLKKRGRPMLVAMRYRPQRYLIGPALFPMYWFVLRVALLCYLVPWALAGLILLVFGTSRPVGEVIGSFWGSLWVTLGLQFSIITIVFAALDYCQVAGGFQQNWNPSTLPAVRPPKDPYRVPRPASLAEVVFGLIFIAWWIVMPQGFPFVWGLEKAGIRWTGPVWEDFRGHYFLAVIGLSLVSIGVSLANVIKPYWTRPRLAIRAGVNAGVALMAYFVVRAHMSEVKAQWFLMTGPNHPTAQAEVLAAWINMGIYLALSIMCVASVVESLKALVKMARWNAQRASMKLGALAMVFIALLGASAARGDKATRLPGHVVVVATSPDDGEEDLILEQLHSAKRPLIVAKVFAPQGWHIDLELRWDSQAGPCVRNILAHLNQVI